MEVERERKSLYNLSASLKHRRDPVLYNDHKLNVNDCSEAIIIHLPLFDFDNDSRHPALSLDFPIKEPVPKHMCLRRILPPTKPHRQVRRRLIPQTSEIGRKRILTEMAPVSVS